VKIQGPTIEGSPQEVLQVAMIMAAWNSKDLGALYQFFSQETGGIPPSLQSAERRMLLPAEDIADRSGEELDRASVNARIEAAIAEATSGFSSLTAPARTVIELPQVSSSTPSPVLTQSIPQSIPQVTTPSALTQFDGSWVETVMNGVRQSALTTQTSPVRVNSPKRKQIPGHTLIAIVGVGCLAVVTILHLVAPDFKLQPEVTSTTVEGAPAPTTVETAPATAKTSPTSSQGTELPSPPPPINVGKTKIKDVKVLKVPKLPSFPAIPRPKK